MVVLFISFFYFKQKTAYEMRISDWSSDVCSSDLKRSAGPRDSQVALADQVEADPLRRGVDERHGHQDQQDDEAGLIPVLHLHALGQLHADAAGEIGRASCRARVCTYV